MTLERFELKANLSYIVKPCLKVKTDGNQSAKMWPVGVSTNLDFVPCPVPKKGVGE